MKSTRSPMKVSLNIVFASLISLALGQGLFNEEQVESGESVYREQCQVCHGDKLLSGEMGGPPLSGAYFFNSWEGKSLTELYEYVQETMPFGQGGLLSKEEYSDVIAFILDYNGFEAGDINLTPGSEVMDTEISNPAED